MATAVPRQIAASIPTQHRSRAMPEPTQGRQSTATFTPAAAAYTGGDVIDTAKEFTTAGSILGGQVKITSAELEIDAAAVQAGETSYRLYLYSVTPPSAPADN